MDAAAHSATNDAGTGKKGICIDDVDVDVDVAMVVTCLCSRGQSTLSQCVSRQEPMKWRRDCAKKRLIMCLSAWIAEARASGEEEEEEEEEDDEDEVE